MELPPAFVHNIRTLHGEVGDEWLRNLPETLSRLADEGDWEIGLPFPNLSYNYVCKATQRKSGLSVVLKVGLSSDTASIMERCALICFRGRGSVRLLRNPHLSGLNSHALELERILPGQPLWDRIVDAATDEAATHIAAAVIRTLPREMNAMSPDSGYPTVARWMSALERIDASFSGGNPFPSTVLALARTMARDLSVSAPTIPCMLHGDLHHGNILSAHESRDGSVPWLAIDPKGVLGDPAYEAAALLRNPTDRLWRLPDVPRILSRRLDILSNELDLPRERLRGWGIAQAVLSAWWTFEDHGIVGEKDITFAEILSGIR